MTGKAQYTPEQLAAILAELRKHTDVTFTQACRRIGVSAHTVRYWFDTLAPRLALERPDLDLSRPVFSARGDAGPDSGELADLRAQLRELKKVIASYDKTYADAKFIRERLFELREEPVRVPDWLVKPKKDGKSPGIPEMIWSDWHWGEVVKREQLNGVNEFNLEIAHRRARRLVERTILLLRHYMVHPTYEGIVLDLGGDMLSGIIHEELVNTNAVAIMAAVRDCFGVLKWAIRELANEFGKIVVFCVVGNHGRSTKKMPSKDAAETSFDWLIYSFLEEAFQGDKRVTVVVTYSADQLYSVYGHRRLLTHGNQFRAGDSIIGPIGPIMRGRQKKHSRNAAIGQGFDVMVHGHWHNYSPGTKVIGNGSLKGYDQFAADNNFDVQDPIQAMWITHPVHGITFHVPVFCEERPIHHKGASIEWVEVKR